LLLNEESPESDDRSPESVDDLLDLDMQEDSLEELCLLFFPLGRFHSDVLEDSLDELSSSLDDL